MTAADPQAFEIEDGGRVYRCERVVSGTTTLRQHIHVLGVGSKADPANYGRNGHPIESMPSTGRLIAHEIIGERAGRE